MGPCEISRWSVLLMSIVLAGVLASAVPRRDIPARCREAGAVDAAWCAGAGSDSLAPHPLDCQLFLYCVEGEAPVCRQCPADLHFSPSEHVCATPEAAGCEFSVPVRLEY